eukprot:1158814-Pelagomonas_calceolata.AAC.4
MEARKDKNTWQQGREDSAWRHGREDCRESRLKDSVWRHGRAWSVESTWRQEWMKAHIEAREGGKCKEAWEGRQRMEVGKAKKVWRQGREESTLRHGGGPSVQQAQQAQLF